MNRPEAAADELRDLYRRLAEIHRVLSAARAGDHDARVSDDLSEAHPLAPLQHDLNEILTALAAERSRSVKARRELEDALATVELQRAALRELSTPIIEVWSGVLCLPVFGMLDRERSAEMMSALLASISAKSAAHVVIDVTAVDVMDSATLDHFLKMARAARLLGAECVLTGIHPRVAEMLAGMEVDLRLLTTRSTLREALTHIMAERPGG